MRSFLVLLAAVQPASARVVNEYPEGDPIAAAQALLERVVPAELQGSFQLELVPRTQDGADVMALASNATAGYAAASNATASNATAATSAVTIVAEMLIPTPIVNVDRQNGYRFVPWRTINGERPSKPAVPSR